MMIEVLAPAGSYDSLKVAVNAGADAVYIGGSSFGARAYADNLSQEDLLRGIDFIHLHNKKLYLTVNTLLKEDELSEQLYRYLLPFYREGLDAVIVQDIGVLSFIRKNFPDLPVHASTQMSVASVYGAQMLEKMGVSRIVTPRELSLTEIRAIYDGTNLEIETFVHGALCYCYSGQCLHSSFIGGRSGNRGRCAQPCRLPYDVSLDGKKLNSADERYLLSPKDLCALDVLPDVLKAGVSSLKIEGRMKKPEYVAGVVEKYRKYVDLYLEKGYKDFQVAQEDKKQLMDLYARGGFTSGYFRQHNDKEMLALSRPNHQGVPVAKVIDAKGSRGILLLSEALNKGDVLELPSKKKETCSRTFKEAYRKGEKLTLNENQAVIFKKGMEIYRVRNQKLIDELLAQYLDTEKKEFIHGFVELLKHKPAKFQVGYRGKRVTVTGDVVQEAQNRPLTEEGVRKQFNRLGNTMYRFETLEIQMDADIFFDIRSMNELRRAGLAALEEEILQSYRREYDGAQNMYAEGKFANTELLAQNVNEPNYTALISHRSQWAPVLASEKVAEIYLESYAVDIEELADFATQAKMAGKKLYYALPHVFRAQASRYFEEKGAYRLNILKDIEDIGYLVRNLDACAYFMERAPKPMVFDASCYQMNVYAKQKWLEIAASYGVRTTISVELNEKELLAADTNGCEFIFYGRITTMISAGCLLNTTAGCKKQQYVMWLKDRMGIEFPVTNICNYCYNIVWNSLPIYIDEQENRLHRFKFGALRYQFTTESEEEVRAILAGKTPAEITRGHFRRGVK